MEWDELRWIKISHTCPSRMPLQSLTMWLRIRTRTRRWLCSCCETTWPSGLPTRKPEIETRQIAGMSAATTAVAESWLGPHTVLGDGGNPHRNWWAERWKRIRGCTCWRVTAPEKPGNSRPKRPEPTERKLAERTSHHSSRCGDCNTSPLQFALNWLQMFRPGARVMSCRLPKMVTSLVQNCSDVHDVHDVDHIRCAMPMKCMVLRVNLWDGRVVLRWSAGGRNLGFAKFESVELDWSFSHLMILMPLSGLWFIALFCGARPVFVLTLVVPLGLRMLEHVLHLFCFLQRAQAFALKPFSNQLLAGASKLLCFRHAARQGRVLCQVGRAGWKVSLE